MGFPDSSVVRESSCNAGDPSLIPGSGRSAGEGNKLTTPVSLGFPCGAAGKESVRNAGDLGWEDPLEKREATRSSILAWRIPRIVYSPQGCNESDMTEQLSLSLLCPDSH